MSISALSLHEDALLDLVRQYPTAGYGFYREKLEAEGIVVRGEEGVRRALRDRNLGTKELRASWAAGQVGDAAVSPDFARREDDKKEGAFDWREANRHINGMQDFLHEASWSQDEAHISFPDATRPLPIIAISDTHACSWGTDHRLLEEVTDEILSIPDLHIILLGDLIQMAIKMRGVMEVSDNALPPKYQMAYLDSWMAEIAPRVLSASWDNHAAEREESQSGVSMYAHLLSRRTIYHNGIGHVDVRVGGQTYKFALSHLFRGRSQNNPCWGGLRYLRHEAPERDIAMSGDSHVPGILQCVEGGRTKTVVNTGSMQLGSGYAKRYFSLKTAPVFPVVTLDPRAHTVTPYWSVKGWKQSVGLAEEEGAA